MFGIRAMRASQQSAARALKSKEQTIRQLRDELGRQNLAIQALTRLLIEKDIIKEVELDDFIAGIDAEDGVIDGKLAIQSGARRLVFEKKKIPAGTFRRLIRRNS